MITLTRTGLLLTLSADTIPAQGSSGVPISFVNDPDTYTGYTIQPLAGWYKNGCKQSAVCRYADDTITVPAAAFQQNGEIMLAVALIDPSDANHIEVTQPASAYVIPAPNDPTELPDEDTWQTAVDEFVTQVMQPYQTNIQGAIDTATQQQQQIDSAISQMGEYQIVSEDPVQIQFKQGDGTFGPTVDLGDGLASKSMVNAGYYQSIGTEYSGAASDYGIQVEEIVGAYSQGSNPSPDNPQEMQAVEISELKSSGRNMFDYQSIVDEATDAGFSTNAVLEEKEGRNCLKVDTNNELFRGLSFLKGRFKTNTQYRFSITGYYEGTVNGIGIYVSIYYTDNSIDSLRLTVPNKFSKSMFTSDENKTIDNIKFSYGNVRQSWLDLDSSYIVELSEDTGEFPGRFVGDTVTLSEPLILRALPNGVCDTYENGVITRRVGVVEFDGSVDEKWKVQQTSNPNVVSFYLEVSNNKSLGYTSMLCDKLTPNTSGTDNTSNVNVCSFNPINGSTLIMDVANEIATTVEDWKTWLQSNPITVWYQLATPTEQDISIPTLKSFYPFTNAWCDSVVQPQITWNALTFRAGPSTVQNNGSTLNTFDVKGAGFFISQDDESVTIGSYDEWVTAGKPAWPTS